MDIGVAPHPGWDALERRLIATAPGPVPDIAIDVFHIRPVGLYRDDREAMRRDQVSGNGGVRLVKFACAMARLAEHHHPAVGQAIQ